MSRIRFGVAGFLFTFAVAAILIASVLVVRTHSSRQAEIDGMYAEAIAKAGDAAPSREEEASALLWLGRIKKVLDADPAGNRGQARMMLTSLIKTLPKTAAAREAHALLRALN